MSDPQRGVAARLRLASVVQAGQRVKGEIERPWQEAFWRDGRPDLDRALHDGDALWGLVMADVQIDAHR